MSEYDRIVICLWVLNIGISSYVLGVISQSSNVSKFLGLTVFSGLALLFSFIMVLYNLWWKDKR